MMMMSFICSCRNNKKGRLCERMRERRRGAREGACIGGATTPQPSILRFVTRLIRNAAALAAASSPTLLLKPW